MNTIGKRIISLGALLVCLCPGRGWGAPPSAAPAAQPVAAKAAAQPSGEKDPAKESPDAEFDKALADYLSTDKKAAAEKAAAQAKAQLDAMAQQWLQQFQPILTTEFAFIRQVSGDDLPKEQRPKIKSAGEASLKDAATKFAQYEQRPQLGGVAQARVESPNPTKVIREGLAQALKEVLTPEQLAHFTEEAAAREAQHKRAAILFVVSRLDELLYLTVDQRQEISTAISSNWQDSWEKWLMLRHYGNFHLPIVPDQYVVDHLNDEQKSVWRGVQKLDTDRNNFFGGRQIGPRENDEEWWDNKPEKPAAVKAIEKFLKGLR